MNLRTTVQKRAAELRVGDKILGNTNWLEIQKIEPGLAGVLYPRITGVDIHGKVMVVDTGKTSHLQDTTWEVEPAKT